MNIRELEVLRVAPDERLIVKLPESVPREEIDELVAAFAQIGLGGRLIVLQYDAAAMTVVSATAV